MPKATPWFEVHREGLAQLLLRHGKPRAVLELLSNAWDEEGVTQVEVELDPVRGQPLVELIVRDNSPEGFRDLRDAFTLFAPSYKKGNPEQRGRFNIGEKLLLALCQSASIASRTGTVTFNQEDGRRMHRATAEGTVFHGILRMTRAEVDETYQLLLQLIPPEGIRTTIKRTDTGETAELHRDSLIACAECTLATEISDDEGALKRTRRKTQVEVSPVNGKPGWLYEMGIPVVEIGGPFSVDVRQKVPLNMDRDNVPPGFLRELRAHVLNAASELMSEDDWNEPWVTDGLAHRAITTEAVKQAMDARFGERRVTYDPSDLEANKLAASEGYTVVHGGSLPAEVWSNVREARAVLPAGKVTPSSQATFRAAKRGEDTINVPESEWTDGMRLVASAYAQIASTLIEAPVRVDIVRSGQRFGACYGDRELLINLRRLGKAWFEAAENGLEIRHLDLLLHECGHEFSGDHLSSQYHDALTRLGAQLVFVCARDPDSIRGLLNLEGKS